MEKAGKALELPAAVRVVHAARLGFSEQHHENLDDQGVLLYANTYNQRLTVGGSSRISRLVISKWRERPVDGMPEILTGLSRDSLTVCSNSSE